MNLRQQEVHGKHHRPLIEILGISVVVASATQKLSFGNHVQCRKLFTGGWDFDLPIFA
jgi:hypothetical protein